MPLMHIVIFSVLIGTLARTWRHVVLAVVATNVALQVWPAVLMWISFSPKLFWQSTAMMLGSPVYWEIPAGISAACAIVVYGLKVAMRRLPGRA